MTPTEAHSKAVTDYEAVKWRHHQDAFEAGFRAGQQESENLWRNKLDALELRIAQLEARDDELNAVRASYRELHDRHLQLVESSQLALAERDEEIERLRTQFAERSAQMNGKKILLEADAEQWEYLAQYERDEIKIHLSSLAPATWHMPGEGQPEDDQTCIVWAPRRGRMCIDAYDQETGTFLESGFPIGDCYWMPAPEPRQESEKGHI
jgi:hypothetical protein